MEFDYYFIIPTINGNIFGKPFISYSIDYDFEECTIYGIKQFPNGLFKIVEIY